LKRYIQDYFMLLVPVGLIILLDQWTKSWVRSNIAFGESWGPEWLAPFARFVHWYNTGAAFGLFQGMGTVFIILAFVISIAILIYYPRVPRQDWTLRLAMSLQMAGALGNLIDRLTIGHVTDFIAIGSFPVWNIADASITVGVFVLLLGIWLQERREKAERMEKSTLPPGGEIPKPEEGSS